MNESVRRGRPKTASSSLNMNDSATLSPTLTYTMLKQATESWRNPNSNWTKSNTPRQHTPASIPGAKYGKNGRNWSIDIGPNSGGFLPILNVKSQRAELSSRQYQKRNKSASTRRKAPAATVIHKPVNTATTASILDLNSIVSHPTTEQKKFTPRLHRETSLPLHLGSISPMLKYSEDSQSEFFLSRMALIENANRPGPSPEPESANDDTLNSMVSRASSQLTSTSLSAVASPTTTTNIANKETNSTAPTTTKASDSPSSTKEHSVPSLDEPPAEQEMDTDTRWQINIRLPGDADENNENKTCGRTDSDGSMSSTYSLPKSILKPKIPAETTAGTDRPAAVTGRRTVELSAYFLSPTIHHTSATRPSPVPPANVLISNQRVRRRRVKLKDLANGVVQSADDSEASQDSVMSPVSVESALQTTNGSSGSADEEVVSDIQKSVRFCDKPAQVKEYFPWEAPQNSIQI